MSATRVTFLLAILCLVFGCEPEQYPKPKGHFRIDIPAPSYTEYDEGCPFSFEYSNYATVRVAPNGKDSCWLDLVYPRFKGTLHMSYLPITDNYRQYLEDSRTLVYKHSVRASNITERSFSNGTTGGMLYILEGHAATPFQFQLSDSTHHFVRGSFYYFLPPNPDSLAPVTAFIQEDLVRLMESFRWR